MKWNEMSVLHKVVFVSTCVSSFALLVVVLCSFGGVLPGLYVTPLVGAHLGTNSLGQTILNWKKQRILAICHLVATLICFVAFLLSILGLIAH